MTREKLKAKYSSVTFRGKTYLPIRDAFLAGSTNAPYYVAYAIKDGEPSDENGLLPVYELAFEIVNPDAEDESEVCDWTEIIDLGDTGAGYSLDTDRII